MKVIERRNLVIDYDLPFCRLVTYEYYSSIYPGITKENFPTKEKGRKRYSILLINFEHWAMTTSKVVNDIKYEGLLPLGIYGLLTYSATRPNIGERIIVAPVSGCGSYNEDYPYIFMGNSSKLNLYLVKMTFCVDQWKQKTIFLAYEP